jgi:hypothetical protein
MNMKPMQTLTKQLMEESNMDRVRKGGFLPALSLMALALFGCSIGNQSSPSTTNNQPAAQQPAQKTEPAKTTAPGMLQVGEASGSYTAKGETVQLRYAYAGHAQRFGSDSLVVLLTDKPIPAEALAEEIKSQTLLLDEKIRGLEYAIDKDGYWVRYHPSQTQESKFGQLKDFSVENDTVKGRDEDNGEAFNGKYTRSVKFVAAISK